MRSYVISFLLPFEKGRSKYWIFYFDNILDILFSDVLYSSRRIRWKRPGGQTNGQFPVETRRRAQDVVGLS